MSSAAYYFLTALCTAVTFAQYFAYPERPGQRLDSKSENGRVPLYVPGLCPENQLLYPGDQKSDWICDCGPGFIYYPAQDACFAAFRRGPCKEKQHLFLGKTDVIPKCVENPCEEGFAKFKGKCYELDKPGGPCAPISEGGGIFGVNATTLEVECLKGTDTLSLISVPHNCPRGSQRDRNNKCRKEFNDP